jgi:hypothetical protein
VKKETQHTLHGLVGASCSDRNDQPASSSGLGLANGNKLKAESYQLRADGYPQVNRMNPFC